MGTREMLAKDLTCSSSLQMKPEKEGSADRVAAMALVASAAARESRIELLGCHLMAYKLPWTAPPDVPFGMRDEFEAVGRARQQRGREEAIETLAAILRPMKHMKPFRDDEGIERIAATSVEEWVDDLCRECHGAGEYKDRESEAVIITCPVCKGHKKHRFDDKERCVALLVEVDEMPHWNRGMEEAHRVIGTAERAFDMAMAQRMGRVLSKD